MVSNAFDKYNNTIEHFNVLFKLSVTYSIKALTTSIVEILIYDIRKTNCILYYSFQ